MAASLANIDAHARDGASKIIVRQAPLAAHLAKRSVPLVEKQELGSEVVGDDQIEPPVGVEIDGTDAERLGAGATRFVCVDLDASPFGDILERSVAAILVELAIGAEQVDGRQLVSLTGATGAASFPERNL